MAEYYPLISRAVAGLRSGTPDSRRAIYDRAKQALIGQLRAMDPPVPEEDIARETAALDEAIARVEADVAPKAAAPDVPVKAAGSSTPPIAARPPPTRPTPPFAPGAPTLGGMQRPDAPTPAPRTSMPSLRPSAPRPARPTLKPEENRPSAPVVDEAPEPVIGTDSPSKPPPADAAPLPVAPTLQVTASDDGPPASPDAVVLRPSASTADGGDDPTATEATTSRQTDDAIRPAAPRPAASRRPDLRVFIVAFAALLAVVAVAFTAWKLRDHPEELARVPSVTKAAEPAVGKIVERADGSPAEATVDATPAPVAGTASPPPAVASDTPAETAGVAPAGTTAPAALPASAPVPAAAPDQALPVAYKAAILVDAPEEPQKVKTYVGTVVWRVATVNQGQDQPIGTAIRGEIDIPDAKVQLVFEMRRNTEVQFPASHTMELKFTVTSDSPVGAIKQIDAPQMRRDDMPTGDPLAGVPVTITENYFLVGLARGASEEPNLAMIRTRNWFDIPMLLSNGKAAKVTFEKGAAGERIFNDVLQGWARAAN